MKKNNNRGFTLAELLIVVAIIAVLVAVAIPVFTTQLEKSRDAVTASNLRAAYAEAATEMLTGKPAASGNYEVTKPVTVKGQQANGAFDNTDTFDLPFSPTPLKTQLDKAGDTNPIQVKFTWTVNATSGEVAQTPTISSGAAAGGDDSDG